MSADTPASNDEHLDATRASDVNARRSSGDAELMERLELQDILERQARKDEPASLTLQIIGAGSLMAIGLVVLLLL